jgi:hypothetical protein
VVEIMTVSMTVPPLAGVSTTELGFAESAPVPPPPVELLKFTVRMTGATPAGSDAVKVIVAECAPGGNWPILPRFKESVDGVVGLV